MSWAGLWKKLKTVPGAALGAIGVAVVGLVVTYFGPRLLDRLTAEDRPKISVRANPASIDTFSDQAQFLIVPYGRRAVGGPKGPGCSGFRSWGASVGGIPAGATNFRLIVQGGGAEVLISGMRAKVMSRKRPVPGTGFRCPGAGEAEIRAIRIDLDDPTPAGRVIRGGKKGPVSFTVAKDETEVFDISATTKTCYCRWLLELDTTQDGQAKVISVSDHGKPFETTVLPGNTGFDFGPGRLFYDWNWEEGEWWVDRGPGGIYPPKTYPPAQRPLPPLATAE